MNNEYTELIKILRGGRQCDEEGAEIIMSRQACLEAADALQAGDHNSATWRDKYLQVTAQTCRAEDEVERLTAALKASESAAVPEGCCLSWNGFNLRGDEKSINEARRLVERVDALEVWMEQQQKPASTKPPPGYAHFDGDGHIPRQPVGAAVPEDDIYAEDKAVDRFTAHMKHKLDKARQRGRSGWQDRAWTPEQISQALREHVEKGDPVDVANYCMFLAARKEPIYSAMQPVSVPVAWKEWRTALAEKVDAYIQQQSEEDNEDLDRLYAELLDIDNFDLLQKIKALK